MSERMVRGLRAAVVGTALLGLLALVALASRGGRPLAGTATDVEAVAQVRDVVLTLAITLYVFLIVVALWVVRKFGPRDVRTGRSPIRGLFVFLAVTGILWLGLKTAEPIRRLVEDEAPFGPERTGEAVRGEEGQEGKGRAAPPPEFEWEIALALVGAAAAITTFLVLRMRRRLPSAPEEAFREGVAGDLVAVIEGTLDELRGEADPRRAVIAAYAQMEQTLGRYGLPRRISEAPFEYLSRILEGLRVRASAVLALTELFERARFSLHTIDETMKLEAIASLAAVRDDLRTTR